MTASVGSCAAAVELYTDKLIPRIPAKRSTLFTCRSHITKGFHLRSRHQSTCGDTDPRLPSIRISAVPNAPKPFHRYQRPDVPSFEQQYSTCQKEYYHTRRVSRNRRSPGKDRSASHACVATTRLRLSGHHIYRRDTKQSKSTICSCLVYEPDSCSRFEKHWSSRADRKSPDKGRFCYIFEDSDSSMRKTWPNTWYRHRSVVLPVHIRRDDKLDTDEPILLVNYQLEVDNITHPQHHHPHPQSVMHNVDEEINFREIIINEEDYYDTLAETETDRSMIYLNDSRSDFPCQLPSLICPHPTPKEFYAPGDDHEICRSPSELSSLPSSTSSSEKKESIFTPSPTANPSSVCDLTSVVGALNEDISQVYARLSPKAVERYIPYSHDEQQEGRETGFSTPSHCSPHPVTYPPTMVDNVSDDAEDDDDDDEEDDEEDDEYEDAGENVMDPNVARLRHSPENIFMMSPTSACRDVCYCAVTDKRYNKWRRRDRDKKGRHSQSRKRKKCQARKMCLLEQAECAIEERTRSPGIHKLPRIPSTNPLVQKNTHRASQSDGSLVNYKYPCLVRSNSVGYSAEKFGFKSKWVCYEENPKCRACNQEINKNPSFHQRIQNSGSTPNCRPKSKIFKTSQSRAGGPYRNSNLNYATLVDVERAKLQNTPIHVSSPYRMNNAMKGNETTIRHGVNPVRLPHSFQRRSRQSQLTLAKQVCKLPSSTALPNNKGRANRQSDHALRDRLIKSLLQQQKKKTEKTKSELRNILGQKQDRRPLGTSSHLITNLNVNFELSNNNNPLMVKNSRPVKQGLNRQVFITQKRMATCMY